jgi:hypothetical protein
VTVRGSDSDKADLPEWARNLVGHISALPLDVLDGVRDELGKLRTRSELVSGVAHRVSDVGAAAEIVDGLVLCQLGGWTASSICDEENTRRSVESYLAAPGIRLLAKATGLSLATERRFEGVRILTDVRPIFVDGPEGAEPERVSRHVVLLNTLELKFSSDGEHKSVWVGMTQSDLIDLKSVVERAIMKSATVLSVLPDGTDRLGNDV